MSDGWIRWTPRVGDRVRVHPSPECRHPWSTVVDGRLLACSRRPGHRPEEDGQTGTVVPWPFPDLVPTDGHDVAVRFDRLLLFQDRGRWDWRDGAAYAASELEPLHKPEGPEDPINGPGRVIK